MDFDDALLLIEEQIESPERFNLNQLAIAFPVVASHLDGYSGKVWEYGAKILELAQQKSINTADAFDKIGWETFKSAIFSGISQQNIMQVLSFTQYNFIQPENDFKTILNDPRIKTAIKDGINAEEHLFINPADFGILTPSGQDAFAELLSVIDDLQVDDELRLQWSASALRFCLPNSRSWIVASEVLVKSLIRGQRYSSAYNLFRALSENCDDLWNSNISLELVKALIQNHINGNNHGLEILMELCSDVDVQNKSKANTSLYLLIGILSIHLWSEHKITEVETMAWEYPAMIQMDYPELSSVLASYITTGELPDLPPEFVGEIDELESKLSSLINDTQDEVRNRTYRGVPLAIKIHQDNLKDYFIPVLENIKRRNNINKIFDQIEKIDPEALVSENVHQRQNNFPIQGRLLQQMINANRDIKRSLDKAGQVLKHIKEIQYERSLVSPEQYEFYRDYEVFCEDLSAIGRWAFEQLIPDLWKALSNGLDVYKREKGHYGTR